LQAEIRGKRPRQQAAGSPECRCTTGSPAVQARRQAGSVERRCGGGGIRQPVRMVVTVAGRQAGRWAVRRQVQQWCKAWHLGTCSLQRQAEWQKRETQNLYTERKMRPAEERGGSRHAQQAAVKPAVQTRQRRRRRRQAGGGIPGSNAHPVSARWQ